MTAITENLERILRNYSGRLEGITGELYNYRPAPGKWSKKEILGHLVDSAQNNIRRFIVMQYEDQPEILYRQDEWVALSGYSDYPTGDLIQLWRLLNQHMVRILRLVPADAAGRRCYMGGSEPRTLEWMAADYCNHLLHHLHQVLDLDPIAYG